MHRHFYVCCVPYTTVCTQVQVFMTRADVYDKKVSGQEGRTSTQYIVHSNQSAAELSHNCFEIVT